MSFDATVPDLPPPPLFVLLDPHALSTRLAAARAAVARVSVLRVMVLLKVFGQKVFGLIQPDG
jgi:hypothetical protein